VSRLSTASGDFSSQKSTILGRLATNSSLPGLAVRITIVFETGCAEWFAFEKTTIGASNLKHVSCAESHAEIECEARARREARRG
jgi:hypothetical protein